jgi:hypothetical protein
VDPKEIEAELKAALPSYKIYVDLDVGHSRISFHLFMGVGGVGSGGIDGAFDSDAIKNRAPEPGLVRLYV